MTLMELMVGMGIMTVFMGIATSAVVSIFSSTNKIQAVADSSSQLSTAFDRLDKQVRYASAIDPPVAPPAGDWSVAFANTAGGTTNCTQLRIRTVPGGTEQQLVERGWTVSTNPDSTVSATGISGWTQLADGISLTDQSGAAVTPFLVSTPAGGTVQQLTLRLVALVDNGNSPTRSASAVSFSALNSAAASTAAAAGPTTAVCAQPEIT